MLFGAPPRSGGLLGWEPKVSFADLGWIMVDAGPQHLLGLRQCQDVIRQLNPGHAPKTAGGQPDQRPGLAGPDAPQRRLGAQMLLSSAFIKFNFLGVYRGSGA